MKTTSQRSAEQEHFSSKFLISPLTEHPQDVAVYLQAFLWLKLQTIRHLLERRSDSSNVNRKSNGVSEPKQDGGCCAGCRCMSPEVVRINVSFNVIGRINRCAMCRMPAWIRPLTRALKDAHQRKTLAAARVELSVDPYTTTHVPCRQSSTSVTGLNVLPSISEFIWSNMSRTMHRKTSSVLYCRLVFFSTPEVRSCELLVFNWRHLAPSSCSTSSVSLHGRSKWLTLR